MENCLSLFGGLDALLDVSGHPAENVVAHGGGSLPEVVVCRVQYEAARVAPVGDLDEGRRADRGNLGRSGGGGRGDEGERDLVNKRVDVALRRVPE